MDYPSYRQWQSAFGLKWAAWLPLLLVIVLAACNSDSAPPTTSQTPAQASVAHRVEVVTVALHKFSTTDRLPAELTPWEQVAIFSKVQGYVELIPVDRGSFVRRGQLLVRLSAPELLAQTAQAEATMAGDEATYRRLVRASETPGATSQNELELARQAYEADRDRVRQLKSLAGYLEISAPFDGVISERNVHPGALVGPPSEPLATAVPLLRLQQISHLRLVVPVPQADADAVALGGKVQFGLNAWPGRSFTASISRIAHSVDPATRTMPVEADYYQDQYMLAPGMFVEVNWPVHETVPTTFVPASAILQTAGTALVDLVEQGHVRQVAVKPGRSMANLVEVFGDLQAGDQVVAQPPADLANGAAVRPVFKPS
jgi:membrane fusion protein (multidrug efflux system)